jgi:two-component SAPR family response regulator
LDNLAGKRVLIAEDEALIAMDLEMIVEEAGGIPIGSYSRLEEVVEAINTKEFDCAILDVTLIREEVFPAADKLIEKGIGFIFHSGNVSRANMDSRYKSIPLCPKPSTPNSLMEALSSVV